MVEQSAEQYRAVMERLYKDSMREEISFDSVVCLEDGKDKFIIGKYAKKEDVAASGVFERGNSAYTSAKSTIFCMPLQNGELTGDPLIIMARAHTAFKIDAIGHDASHSAKSEVNMRIGGGSFYFSADKDEFVDVTNPQEVSHIVEQSISRRVASDLRYKGKVDDEKKYMQATNLVNRFVAPVASVNSLIKQEENRIKRVRRFGELRKMVLKKREKLAKAQEKLRAKQEKVQKALKQKSVDKFLS